MLQHNCSTPFQVIKASKFFVLILIATSYSRKIGNDHDSSLSLKPSSSLKLLVNQYNNAAPENCNDLEKMSSSKYYDIEEMQSIEILHKNKLLALFHINACSLYKIFDDLQHLLTCTKKDPSLHCSSSFI